MLADVSDGSRKCVSWKQSYIGVDIGNTAISSVRSFEMWSLEENVERTVERISHDGFVINDPAGRDNDDHSVERESSVRLFRNVMRCDTEELARVRNQRKTTS